MTAKIGLIVVSTGALILLSLMTLTTIAPWAAITVALVGLFFVGEERHWFND